MIHNRRGGTRPLHRPWDLLSHVPGSCLGKLPASVSLFLPRFALLRAALALIR